MQFEKVDDDYLMYDGGDAATKAADKAAPKENPVKPSSCDSEDSCCKCLPLGCGVSLLGIFSIINTILLVISGIDILGDDAVWGVVALAMTVGPVYCTWRFSQWFRDKDNEHTRGKLPCAYLVMYFFYALGNIFAIMGDDGLNWLGFAIQIGVQFFLTWYYYKVLKRYVHWVAK